MSVCLLVILWIDNIAINIYNLFIFNILYILIKVYF